MKNGSTPERRSRGRSRGFDSAKALDKALKVFWRLGYEGASIADLTKAMGITAPSLYAAFESKAGLYRQVLVRYRAVIQGMSVRARDGASEAELLSIVEIVMKAWDAEALSST